MPARSKFKLTLLVLLLCGVLIKSEENQEQRIVEGKEVNVSFLSRHVVSLRYVKERVYGLSHFCGGTILSVKVILTAGHCLYNPSQKLRPEDIKVVAGNRDRNKYHETAQSKEVNFYTLHPEWRKKFDFNADIAMIFLLKKLFEDGINVLHIKLNPEPPRLNQICSVAGWGRKYSNGPRSATLLYALLKVEPSDLCGGKAVTRYQICALDEKPADGQSAMCDGDDGAPFVCQGLLTGIGSRNSGNCENFNYFTAIYTHRDWIKKNFRNSALKASIFIEILMLAISVQLFFSANIEFSSFFSY